MTFVELLSLFVDCSSRKLELVAQCVCFFIVSFLHLLLKAPVPSHCPCYRFVGSTAFIVITHVTDSHRSKDHVPLYIPVAHV